MGRPRKNLIDADFGDGMQIAEAVQTADQGPSPRMVMDMGLTPAQEDLLITDTLRRMMEDGEKRDLQAGKIPALVRTPVGDAGVQYMLIDIDVRILEDIWRYYRENVPGAEFVKFLDKLDSIKGKHAVTRIYARVGFMNVD